ncbi:uncharacterized protein LOC125756965 [Rhipicephalus sanguineus]|uniref:uncharacterized protein LOC125756965 n=1 Tax=Rhipicephalus sanguineus TaxID=34632 RepID=UPI0020C41F11|nr:uncharacterized protein LOC125756965 [Rhipicephalus sanguineus]
MSIGCGFSNLNELFASMDIPGMSSDTYAKIQDNVGDFINQAAWDEMKKAGAEEARLARECGEIDNDGVPMITVVADGAWSKRSYKNKYDASSGVAAIIGHRTGKVLYIGVKNKRRVKEHHPGADVDYGLPDMEPGALATASENFVKSLSLSVTSIEDLQRATSKQSGSSLWKQERRKRLTASVFGAICKMKPTTGCGRTVGDILYKEISSEAIRYGRDHECVALRQLEKECNVVVKQCGLFVDQENPFLGASPDGLIGEDVLVEVKCPYSARDLTPLEGVRAKKITYCTENEDGKLKLKSNSNYWYQVQGQMNISRRQKCLFVVWTKNGISIEAISRDEVFWKNEMFPRLKTFYMHCMLPELVDPRRSRGLPIREPDHITEAQKNRLLKQALKKTSRNGDCQ